MRKSSLSLDKEIVLHQDDTEAGFFSEALTDCAVSLALGLAVNYIYDLIRTEAGTCDCTETCVSCKGTCQVSCNGSCGCWSVACPE